MHIFANYSLIGSLVLIHIHRYHLLVFQSLAVKWGCKEPWTLDLPYLLFCAVRLFFFRSSLFLTPSSYTLGLEDKAQNSLFWIWSLRCGIKFCSFLSGKLVLYFLLNDLFLYLHFSMGYQNPKPLFQRPPPLGRIFYTWIHIRCSLFLMNSSFKTLW